tara:strand:+ start:25116 stop:25607 length:492 start_codon:yes stop_codon:yes gene_type:complete
MSTEQSKLATFILDFYNGEEFANNKDTLLPITPALYDFVTDADADNLDDMWADLLEMDSLTEMYEEMIEAVIDFDEKTWNTNFSNGDVKIAQGDNVLIINIQPSAGTSGVEVSKEPPHTHSKGLIKDMGLYNIAVKFYILDREHNAEEYGEMDDGDDSDSDSE